MAGATAADRKELDDDAAFWGIDVESDETRDCFVFAQNMPAFNAWARFGNELFGGGFGAPSSAGMLMWLRDRYPRNRRKRLVIYEECRFILVGAREAFKEQQDKKRGP